LAAVEQGVQMISLRDGFMQGRTVFDLVALANRDLIEVVGEHPRAHHARDTPADNYCMFAQSVRHSRLTPRRSIGIDVDSIYEIRKA
jgi:hypothetical protein